MDLTRTIPRKFAVFFRRKWKNWLLELKLIAIRRLDTKWRKMRVLFNWYILTKLPWLVQFLLFQPCWGKSLLSQDPHTVSYIFIDRNWVFATNSDFPVPISLQPDVVNLRYFKLSVWSYNLSIKYFTIYVA